MKNVNRNFESFMNNKSKVDNSEKEKVLISFIHYQITEWVTLDGGGGCYKMFWKEKKVRSQVSLNWSQLNIWWCAYQCFARMEHWDLNLHCWYGSVQHSTHSEREKRNLMPHSMIIKIAILHLALIVFNCTWSPCFGTRWEGRGCAELSVITFNTKLPNNKSKQHIA